MRIMLERFPCLSWVKNTWARNLAKELRTKVKLLSSFTMKGKTQIELAGTKKTSHKGLFSFESL